MSKNKNACVQRAVWRQSGCGSRTVLWDFGSSSPVRAFVSPRPNAKPPERCAQPPTVQWTMKRINELK
jgi:hypothetical protein